MEQLDQRLRAYCEENRIYGVLRVTQRDQILYEGAYGYADRDSGIRNTRSTRFTLYSLSKPFCAIGALKLVDQGRLDLDQHPSVYLAEAEGFDARVTVRHLLHHTSGLPDYEQDKDFCNAHLPGTVDRIREHTRLLTAYPSHFAPGEKGMYANVNFVLLALIIEEITGQAYADYLQKEVLRPLGMGTAEVDHGGRVLPNTARGYGIENGEVVPVEKSLDWLFGAGDLVGSVDDVYCLNRAIKHRLLLSPDTWQMALTPSPINQMGMGCTVCPWHGREQIRHNGGHRGFRTLHIQLPKEDFDLILLSNSGFGNARDDLSAIVHQAFFGGSDGNATVAMDTGYI